MSGSNHQIANENDTVLLTFTFYNTAGALATPSTTTFAQRTPAQTETGGTAVTTGWTTASAGVQTRTVALTSPGLWRFEARGVGNSVDDVQTYTIDVRRAVIR